MNLVVRMFSFIGESKSAHPEMKRIWVNSGNQDVDEDHGNSFLFFIYFQFLL